ncbi:MAG: tetratricopeptide repeat protein [Cyanobacteria bacterium]|nr:tetratricopeptide repeat protein [Cyanobacteriota bacterium]
MHALIIFAVALTVRLIHMWQLQGTPFFDVLLGDANGYDKWAQRLAAGDWIGTDVFYQAPLYPYFLGSLYALVGRDLLLVRIIQAVIGSASCVLLGLAAEKLVSPKPEGEGGFSTRVGLIAGLALALWAPAIFFDSLLQKSVLDMFFMCLSLWLIARILGPPEGGPSQAIQRGSGPSQETQWGSGFSRTIWLSLGMSMAALSLSRENGLLLIGVVAVWLWFLNRRGVWLFAAGLAIVFAPVVARNYSVDGGFYLTTSQFGSNFYIGNNPNADGTYASIRFGRGAPEFERLDAKDVAEESAGRALSASEVSSFWTGRAIDYITSEPLSWLKLTGRKILLLFNRTEMLDTEAQESYEEFSVVLRGLAWVTHFGLLVPLAVAGVILTWPDRRRLWIVHALALTYAISVVMFFVFARYRYPLVPFLILFAAAIVHRPLKGSLSKRQQFVAAATVIAIAIFANVPVLSSTLMRSITENNLGTALLEKGRYDEAIAHNERSIALRPDYAPGYNNLGAALRAAGRLDEAVARYRQALEIKPDFASASYNLANALLEQGKAVDSAASFRRAIEQNPNSVEAHNNLGIALANKGDAAGAIASFRNALAVDDRSVNAHRNLGNMLIDAGRRDEGLAHLERAAALAPSEPEAVYDIGTVLLQEQKLAAAAARFQAALKIRPDWAEAHNNLGIALASQGRIAEALTYFERAVELNPSLQDARANRDQARAALKQ